jgi:hypothetical protein
MSATPNPWPVIFWLGTAWAVTFTAGALFGVLVALYAQS